ncbi:Mitochondrial outer membrane protein iml2 [Orbilia ellipsospora]|uniref:Inclusion body clearance protein IML2 n=1 Tax=Orbilia ellipsospora TaxID=2528407 RepID=A0AAV9XTA5_9PEZI
MFKNSWFSSSKSGAVSPAIPATTLQPAHDVGSSISLSGLDEQAEIIMVMRAMDHVMDDNLEAAEAELATGNSVWHKLGNGAVGFIRSAAGFEQAVMKEASENLAAAESAAHNAQRAAIRSPKSTSSYPPGIEFALANAETQLMSAVIGVLSESIVEAMKSFYKMRTAFKTLEGVSRSIEEVKAKKKLQMGSTSSVSTITGNSGEGSPTVSLKDEKGRFPGATVVASNPEFKNAVDEYIESGGNLCYGTLLLFIGMIPPAMSKLLSVLGFHGDRRKGIQHLWESANMKNSHGALAAIILLVYYNMLQYCDINETDETKGGVPQQKCEELLFTYRNKYTNSPMWILEEARAYAQKKDLETAVRLLEFERKPQMKQIEAICLFEKSLDLMCLHQYQKAADSLIHLVDLNSWSDAMYYYIAASCYVELYRETIQIDKEKAEEYSKKAEEFFLKVPTFLGKKKFMARALPLEVLSDRKVKKWQKFAKERKCTLVEAIGVSPLEEMLYMWNGFARMNKELISKSIKVLDWKPPVEEEQKPKSCITEKDEKVLLSFLNGVLARHMEELPRAKEIFEKEVIPVEKVVMKGEDWVPPSAHYEMAVVIWKESGMKEAKAITEYLNKCAGWESYELDNRLGLRATTALDVIKQSEAADKAAVPPA